MRVHEVRVHPPGAVPPREEQLAWKLAAVAADPAPLDPEAAGMLLNRILDNAGCALAALGRAPVAQAYAQALARPAADGATLTGLGPGRRFAVEWAAWANGVAVRELDFHDTFLAADYAHPADSIPPVLAVAQRMGRSGADLLRGLAAAYEVHVALVKAICLHRHAIDHVAHLAPAAAAGIGALLGLPVETIYQAVQQALHVGVSTRQSRKGTISGWKACAPAHAGKLAVEAVDRAMRGGTAPTPVYEGEDSVIARVLDGPDAVYRVALPEPGEPRRAVLETYTKAHSAEYQAQAFIDLALRLRPRIGDPARVRRIVAHTSHHTHKVIGTGSGDPEKFDPGASRETLDHSLMYILAVALEDGAWHHERSYAPGRAGRPSTLRLWRRIGTREDPAWTARYHAADPAARAFGGRLEVELEDGTVLTEEIAVADAHPAGARPFGRADYLAKFDTLAEPVSGPAERRRFVDAVLGLPDAPAGSLASLTVAVPEVRLGTALPPGIL
ncbi:MAG TPA: MmgE/PrpD family protein [Azospirillaceae bacterium]|nr:MmgE/PrpD family protein [Azospirillaceae bacterium]